MGPRRSRPGRAPADAPAPGSANLDPGAAVGALGERPRLDQGLVLVGWLDPAVIALAVVAFAAGFGQFGAVASLGSVAKSFGHVVHGATLSEQAGLSGTELGIGLAVIRLASLGGLFVAGSADRVGRRTVLLVSAAVGLLLTIAAAASPGYWWFVVVFAAGRPALSGTSSVAQVAAAEETSFAGRAKAIALVTGAYGAGSGLTAVVHSLASAALGFRGILALAAVPLLLVYIVRRKVPETARYRAASREHVVPVLGPVGRAFRRRLAVVAGLAFAVALVTGPANSFVFLYAQNIEHLPGYVTALMVVAAGVAGLGGLVVGQRLADRVGRRPAAAIGMGLLAVAGVVAYSGSRPGLVAGYIFGVAIGGMFAPAAGALGNELFPTAVRASVAGWYVAAGVVGAAIGLVVFGELVDVVNSFSLAAAVTFLPVIPAAGLFFLVPETRGREPEEMWGDGSA